MVSNQLNKSGDITVSLIRKRLALLITLVLLTLATFSMSVSASNEALFDLLKVLVDKGTITADEYSMLKGAASADHEKASVAAPEKVAGIEKKLGKLYLGRNVRKSRDP